MKGVDPEFVGHFHLQKMHAPQGLFVGKRAGMSPSRGKAARYAVHYDARRRVIRALSGKPEGRRPTSRRALMDARESEIKPVPDGITDIEADAPEARLEHEVAFAVLRVCEPADEREPPLAGLAAPGDEGDQHGIAVAVIEAPESGDGSCRIGLLPLMHEADKLRPRHDVGEMPGEPGGGIRPFPEGRVDGDLSG